MIKRTLFFLLFLCSSIICNTDYSIVFVHIGSKLPAYLPIALRQAKLFNPETPIILLANQEAINSSSIGEEYQVIPVESLTLSDEHRYFKNHNTLNFQFWGGFWKFTTQRFYYLYDYMHQNNSSHVFHLEYDNMLYADLSELLPIFSENYHNSFGATFDNDQRCIAGFIYVPNKTVIKELVTFMNKYLSSSYNDMQMLGLFKNHYPQLIKNLPIIPAEYANDYPLVSQMGHRAAKKEDYYHCGNIFKSVFDAAALGQYLGGIDPRNGPSNPGFINESCIFNPSYFKYEWIKDGQGRKVPYMVYKNKKYKIVNLHIHSKKLVDFYSVSKDNND